MTGQINCPTPDAAGPDVAAPAPSNADGKDRFQGVLGRSVSLMIPALGRAVVVRWDRAEETVEGYNMSVRLDCWAS